MFTNIIIPMAALMDTYVLNVCNEFVTRIGPEKMELEWKIKWKPTKWIEIILHYKIRDQKILWIRTNCLKFRSIVHCTESRSGKNDMENNRKRRSKMENNLFFQIRQTFSSCRFHSAPG